MAWGDEPVQQTPTAPSSSWGADPLQVTPRFTPDEIAARKAKFQASTARDIANVDASRQDNGWNVAGDVLKGAGDTTASLLSQMVMTPAAGALGVADLALGRSPDHAADVVRYIQSLGYTPKSDNGKSAAEIIAKPLTWADSKADTAGQYVSDATGSPLAGTLTKTGIEAIPLILSREGGIMDRTSIGPKGITVAPTADASAAAALDATRATYDPAQAGSSAATAAAHGAEIANATQAAKAYATGTLGLDWDTLSGAVKAKITNIASHAADLKDLDPKGIATEAQLQSLPVPVPATRSQLLRDPAGIRAEANAAGTAAGGDIANIHNASNQALLDNLDALDTQVRGTGTTAARATVPSESGNTLTAAVKAKEALSKANYSKLYDAADTSGETLAKADVTPIVDLIKSTPDQSHFGYAKAWIDQNSDGAGSGMAIRDLEDLRKAAVAKAMNGGEDGYYAGKLISAIDDTTAGAGGDLYKAARAARKAHAMEFDEQGLVSDLVSNKSRMDPTTRAENAVNAVKNGSLDQIEGLKSTLLTGGNATTRTMGKQAWREVRSQVIQDIKDKATSGIGVTSDGTPNLTPGKLNAALRSYGPEKLDAIFGPATASTLDRLMEAAKVTKVIPSSGPPVGSTTVQNVLSFLEKGLTKTPVVKTVAKPVVDVVRGLTALKEMGAGTSAAQQAVVTPLNEAAQAASAARLSQATNAARLANAKNAARIAPISDLYSDRQ